MYAYAYAYAYAPTATPKGRTGEQHNLWDENTEIELVTFVKQKRMISKRTPCIIMELSQLATAGI